jgi:hypothetical protein
VRAAFKADIATNGKAAEDAALYWHDLGAAGQEQFIHQLADDQLRRQREEEARLSERADPETNAAWDERTAGQSSEPYDQGHDVPEAVELFPQLDWVDVFSRDPTEHQWLVEPVLPAGRFVLWYSDNRAMKSLLALYVAACLSAGRAVLGRPAGEPMDVLYIDAEMTVDDVQERLEAMGFRADDLMQLHYLQQTLIPPFDGPDGGNDLATIAKWYGAELVVIDTMAESVAGKENDSDTYRWFSMFTGRHLRAEGITLLILDHEGRDPGRGPRGSTAKKGYVDVVVHVVKAKDERSVTLTTTYSRQSWVPKSMSAAVEYENGVMSYRLENLGYPAGTLGTAQDLDSLKVPLNASVRTAQAVLRKANKGKRQALVNAALKYRRDRSAGVSEAQGYTPPDEASEIRVDTPVPDQ